MESPYFGLYKSSTEALTGCVKEFATKAQSSLQFPPQVYFECDLCHNRHSFRFMRSVTVATPNQLRSFEIFCQDHLIEREVEVL